MTFPVETLEASASEIHLRHRQAPARRQVWICTPSRDALILGSTQRLSEHHESFAARHGFELARRSSGGTGVVVVRGGAVWVDIGLPPGDPLLLEDVSRSFAPVSHAWSEALALVGLRGVRPYSGRMYKGEGLAEVCFAGRASGELMLGERKLVGMSQRRSGHGAWFHTMAYLRFPAALTAEALLPELPGASEFLALSVADLYSAGADVGAGIAQQLTEAIAAQLSTL